MSLSPIQTRFCYRIKAGLFCQSIFPLALDISDDPIDIGGTAIDIAVEMKGGGTAAQEMQSEMVTVRLDGSDGV